MARKKPAPTFEERSAAAAAKAGAALSVFEVAAADLQQAAVEEAAVQADIDAQLDALRAEAARLHYLRDDSVTNEVVYIEQANKIRALAGIN